ncbi:MAG: polysaccharide deacetylase family protein [Bacteroidaceae bacterium]|nr:polysaccharide deacetylase family protein [Bacteroidaceae bacterium]MBR6750297.1 polysaccharide deacetylase family protein [Bacteroidaceae bacterium]
MFIERPPFLYRMYFSEALWRIPHSEKCVYLTFDDGPIPQVTPWVLDILKQYDVPATFFCTGDNVARNPGLFDSLRAAGHQVGNHTMSHVQGLHMNTQDYLRNIEKAHDLIQSPLFRPPHGFMRPSQFAAIKEKYTTVMWDVVTRDYSRNLNGEQVFDNVRRYVRNGSIIVFHDSLKSQHNLRYALPRSIEWLLENGYAFRKF